MAIADKQIWVLAEPRITENDRPFWVLGEPWYVVDSSPVAAPPARGGLPAALQDLVLSYS